MQPLCWCQKHPRTSMTLQVSGKHQIRFAGESGRVQPKAVAHGVNKLADNHFRLHPLAPDLAHILTAPIWGKRVHVSAVLSGDPH